MFLTLTLSLILSAAPVQQPEPKKIPEDSVEVETRGCFKGRVFTATGMPEGEGTSRGPNIVGRNFRVSAKREVMDLVKKYDGQWVQIVGIIRKLDLAEGPSMRVGGGRITVGPGSDPRMSTRTSAPTTPVMDVSSVQFLLERCPLQ